MQVTARRSLYIPWLFVGGLGLVIAVNTVLITFAYRSPPGVIVEHPYETGLHYNQAIAANQREAAIGWHVSVGMTDSRLRVEARDSGGLPLDRATVTASFVRPIEGNVVPPVLLSESGPGQFGAMVSLPLHGQWEVTVTVERDGQTVDETTRVLIP